MQVTGRDELVVCLGGADLDARTYSSQMNVDEQLYLIDNVTDGW